MTFQILKSKLWDAYDKNCWFYEPVKLSYFTFKNGQETVTEFISFWRQFVFSGLFTPCYWGEIQRLRKCQVILNRVVSPIYWVVLTKILWRTMRKMLKKYLTHKVMSHVDVIWRFGLAIQVPFLKVQCKIAQVCALVKSTIFIVGISNFRIVYFKCYIFILVCGKNF